MFGKLVNSVISLLLQFNLISVFDKLVNSLSLVLLQSNSINIFVKSSNLYIFKKE